MAHANILEKIIERSGAGQLPQFLAEYWQKQPCYLPQVAGDLIELVSPEVLFELATIEHVESRLVRRSSAGHYSCENGPFEPSYLAQLPERDWTLLVQDVDKHLPAAHRFLQQFQLVPRWRLDDLMVSYAAPGGGVGPHIDSYDVFLFQALGARRWEISQEPPQVRWCDACELRVLEDFSAERAWDVRPGDALYLPPGIPHYGVALERCMTFSVGFRAATAHELLFNTPLLGELSALWQAEAGPAYRDQALPPRGAGELSAHDRQAYQAAFAQLFASEGARSVLDRCLAQYLTEPKPSQLIELPEATTSAEQLWQRVQSGGALTRHPASRWLYYWDEPKQRVVLAVDGVLRELGPESREWVAYLANEAVLLSGVLLPDSNAAEHVELLLELLAAGQLVWQS